MGGNERGEGGEGGEGREGDEEERMTGVPYTTLLIPCHSSHTSYVHSSSAKCVPEEVLLSLVFNAFLQIRVKFAKYLLSHLMRTPSTKQKQWKH